MWKLFIILYVVLVCLFSKHFSIIYCATDENLGCFQFGTITNIPYMNFIMHAFWWSYMYLCISFEHILRNGTAATLLSITIPFRYFSHYFSLFFTLYLFYPFRASLWILSISLPSSSLILYSAKFLISNNAFFMHTIFIWYFNKFKISVEILYLLIQFLNTSFLPFWIYKLYFFQSSG